MVDASSVGSAGERPDDGIEAEKSPVSALDGVGEARMGWSVGDERGSGVGAIQLGTDLFEEEVGVKAWSLGVGACVTYWGRGRRWRRCKAE